MTVSIRDCRRSPSDRSAGFTHPSGGNLFQHGADGLAFGLVLYPICKTFAGRTRDVSPLMWGLGALFVARYAFLKF